MWGCYSWGAHFFKRYGKYLSFKLRKHLKSKHPCSENIDKDFERENHPEELLYLDTFGNMLMYSELKVAADKCYEGEIRDGFKIFKVNDNDTLGYSMVKLLGTSSDGDIERFYSLIL